MQTNGKTIPDAGSTKEYITDPIGGWMYVITTSVDVTQVRLDDFKAHIDDMKSQIVSLQATVAELEPQVDIAIQDMPAVTK